MAVDSKCSKRLPRVRRRHTFGFSINQPGDLDLLTFNLVRIIAREISKFPANFGVSGTFRSRLMGRQLSVGPRDLATLTFDLVGDTGLRVSSVYEVWSS